VDYYNADGLDICKSLKKTYKVKNIDFQFAKVIMPTKKIT